MTKGIDASGCAAGYDVPRLTRVSAGGVGRLTTACTRPAINESFICQGSSGRVMPSVRFLPDTVEDVIGGVMRFSLLLASSLLLLASFEDVYAQDAAPSQAKLRGFSMSQNFSYNGFTYTYRLATSDLENTPSWNPLSGDPPLPLRKALDVASENLRRFVTGADDWEVEHIDLKQLDVEKWIYEVSFKCNHKGCSLRIGTSFNILVKMDGSFDEPQITPYEPPKSLIREAKPNNSMHPTAIQRFSYR